MYIYWNEKTDLAKSLINGTILNSEIVKDKKRNYNTKKFDRYLKIGSGFDTETTLIKSDGVNIGSYVYHWQFSFGNTYVLGRSLDEFEDFLKYLLSKIPNGLKILTYVANLGYDYYFVKNRLSKYKISRHFEKKTKNPLVIEVDEKIVFRECIGLFGRSLEDIANNFCKTKKLVGDLDHNLTRLSKTPLTKKEIAYCVNDVKILSELGDYTFKHYYGDYMSLPLTAISELREDVKKEMGRNFYNIKNTMISWMPDDEDEYYLFRNYLFKGGLCGSNSLLIDTHLKNVGHADFVSHYPGVMNHYQYPMGKAIKCRTEEFMTEKIPYIAVIKFIDLKSKTTHSILSSHKALGVSLTKLTNRKDMVIDNGRIWRAKEVTFVVNDVEFQSICQAYNFNIEETEILECWKFEKYGRLPYYLLNVLNKQYLKKVDLKNRKLDKTTDYVFAKNKVNGMFGMTCTALYMDKFNIDDNGEIFPERDENGNKSKRLYKDALKSVFLSPYWGMWITSYARMLLIDVICKFPNSIIQYDTDSIFFITNTKESKKLIEYINRNNEMTMEFNRELFNNEKVFEDLGCFEFDEELMTDFKGLGSKRYMFRQRNKKTGKYYIDTVVSGCKKGTILDQFKYITGLDPEENINELFKFFKNGMKIDKEHSKKLTSKYINNYDGENTKNIIAFDYNRNPEKITLESCVLLEPAEFNMGISDIHIRFYMMIQNMFNNTPARYCNMFDNIIDTYDLSDNITDFYGIDDE